MSVNFFIFELCNLSKSAVYDTAQSNFVSITVSQRYSEETTNFLFDPPLGPGGFNSCRTKFPKKSNDIAFVIGITKAKH